MKSVRIRSYSELHFPASGLNTERYGVPLHIWSERGKMQFTISPNKDTFHAVVNYLMKIGLTKWQFEHS